jgi:AraC-like DNA-binding protein
MDRHFIQGATAKAVAEAHQLDLKNQDKYKCKAMTYWFEENSGIAFCLIEAPDENAVIEMHKNSHGLVPNQIIEVDGNIVKLFLGRISDPETTKGLKEFENFINETGYRTIVKIKLRYKLFLKLMYGEDKAMETIGYLNNLIQESIKRYDGREVENADEGFMASFTSASNSVKCALEIKENFEKFNKNSGCNISAAIGLCSGPPITDRSIFFGDTIKLAERLCDIADGNKVILSSTVGDVYNERRLDVLNDKAVKILNPSEDKFLNQLMELTEKIWNEETFNVDNFSKQIGFSRTQLYRKVTSLTGYSPNEFLREYKLKRALKLLEKKKGNISEIAFESGFGNPSYFSKCFQKKFGILPSDYINRIA